MGFKVVFLTNQASYHQMDYARAMVACLGVDNFRIVFQKPTSDARAEMGWQDDYRDACIIRWWKSDADQALAREWIATADVVLQGRFPINEVRKRIRQGRLTIACQERLWKRAPNWLRRVSRLPHLYKNYYSVDVANYHFFAIGAFAAADLRGLGVFANRMWQFGYFIDAPDYPEKLQSDVPIQLLWCARLSAVKQPIKAVHMLRDLLKKGLDCHLTLIGDGDLRTAVAAEIDRLGLASSIDMVGWQTQDQVREHMARADLFIMTSHHGEGWGMVVNEAMSYGCCVLANQELGAAAWLVEDEVTGFLYDDQHVSEVVDRIANLTRDQLQAMGRAGHQRMHQQWSAKVAADRTVALSNALLNQDLGVARALFPDGPCSPL
ncbi:glycosyltransferase family 4 protein [Arenicella xantha]|uniref:Glycosyl transferase family 1 n=1 Tax=Arenicella xantha TaxID=644221 RepID=A0A395JMX7_9GAMM|nr:glycosyltransferase family 4 protein [Arenicella xantha]RBP52827.1 glycosyl transferase family 1 [Arenicella xantha]